MSEELPFMSHLVELRDRVIRAIVPILVVFFILFSWRNELLDFLSQPLLKVMPVNHKELIAIGVITSFMVPVKIAFVVSFLLCLPYVLYQVWSFIAPGLYRHEKKWILPIVVSSYLLFIVGMAFAYYAVFPIVFGFIQSTAASSVTIMTDIEQYFSFIIRMFIAFGVTFEVPIVVLVLVKAGVVSIEALSNSRPYIIVGSFVIAAIATPPDVFSQLLLAIPMCLLFELGLFIAKITSIKPIENPPIPEQLPSQFDNENH